ncbi:hypothetical protein [Saccharothrix sp.]|uniref:hypothetical protein n=1 Tax=Saccharothrix sp. TaxID=1873460 RepID=UPI0028122C32|nr:hypothetical protein [Saccharothrix sp.]
MSTTVSRAVLGALAGLTAVGGALLVVETVIYFSAGGVFGSGAPELSDVGGWGIVTGIVAVLVYAVGHLPVPLAKRIALGCVFAVVGRYVIEAIASLAAEVIDVVPGSEEARLEDGVVGGLWLLAGAFIVWRVVSGRWPVARSAV